MTTMRESAARDNCLSVCLVSSVASGEPRVMMIPGFVLFCFILFYRSRKGNDRVDGWMEK